MNVRPAYNECRKSDYMSPSERRLLLLGFEFALELALYGIEAEVYSFLKGVGNFRGDKIVILWNHNLDGGLFIHRCFRFYNFENVIEECYGRVAAQQLF